MKKLLCVLLTLSLLVCALILPVDAADQPYPLVIVRGMDFLHGLSYDTGLPTQREAALSLDAKGVIRTLFTAFGKLVTGGKRAAVGEILDYAVEALSVYRMTPDGDPADPNVASEYFTESAAAYPEMLTWRGSNEEGLLQSSIERYGAGNVYFFKYDWRLDARENAAYLSELIETACAEHGTDKVDLVCCSMGGIVTLTYMNDFGVDRLDSVVSDSSTMGGTAVTTELMEKKVYFDEGAALRFLQSKLPRFGFVWRTAAKTGLLRGVVNFLNRFAADNLDEIYDEVLTPTFGSMPAVWELVQPDEYETAKAILFGDKRGDYAGLLAKTDAVQREVVSRRVELLQSAMDAGVKLTFIAGYNTPLTPAYEGGKYQGDGTLETRWMSLGALTSEIGSELSDADKAVGDPKYLSPDGCINASTCAFPDLVWFIKDAPHVGCLYGSGYTELIFTLLEYPAQPDVNTFPAVPQFTWADGNQDLHAF